jgi:hypothetical protein
MPSTYNCTACKEAFDSKMGRHNHFRNVCQMLVSLMDVEGAIHRVERIGGKFLCPRCTKTFTRSDTLNQHWKVCMMKGGNESSTDYIRVN